MSVDRWNTALVLGGIRSGKSAFAEALVADAASVRYVATAAGGEDDPGWMNRIEAHQRRRPQTWSTEETGADPGRLAAVLAEAKPDDTLLIDDLGGWVATLLDPANQPQDDVELVTALAAAVQGCAGRVVLVSPEVGLSLVPATPVGRAFADALGTTNQALAAVCDRVALVVAGQTTWIKPGPAAAEPDVLDPAPAPASVPAPAAPTIVAPPAQPPVEATPDLVVQPDVSAADDEDVVFEPGMDLPMPDQDAGPDARDRLATLDLSGGGVGPLAEAIEFAAGTQSTAQPRPWTSPRVLLLSGAHSGGAAAGDDQADVDRRVNAAAGGEGALIRLAGRAGADVAVVRTQPSNAMEDGPVLSAAEVDEALRRGWALAAAAARDGRDVLVIAACGVGTDAAAAAVLSATTGAEPVAVLPRVLAPGGTFDDNSWMVRCAAVRDALHRIRHESRGAQDILAQLGGADVAVATGVLLGAAARQLPVLLDGPVGIAAGLVARDLGSQVRHWCLVPDAGTFALVKQGADVLGLTPVTSLGLDLGEGLNALAALPLISTAIGLAADLPVHPALLAGHDD
ncbi:bifunctional adenosylcobinamide kinase/adenosylcobinamide-phosphate guanylyltransferase [Actinoplanes sp. NPDC051633]|uniref:bifunctional adenosylcobinamide kinase/adenosylcobinamide-phosphate guanylyltransferase n=1 Tax=Actinoplanes sp. NPDC051633 TaxID=3155670 RepID=UPI0034296009